LKAVQCCCCCCCCCCCVCGQMHFKFRTVVKIQYPLYL